MKHCNVKKSTNEEKIILLLSADLGILSYSSENIVRRTELLGGLGRLIAQDFINHVSKYTGKPISA